MNDNLLALREVQLAELDILLKVIEFFEKHGITYTLCGGTMLGAVRHKGFIPWDDDIDLLVPRDDYEKLRALAKNFSLDDVEFHCPGDDGYIYPYIKAVNPNILVDYGKPDDNNLWIDIFPLDHFPDNHFMHWLYVQRLVTLERALSITTYNEENLRERGYYSSMKGRIKLFTAKFLYHLFGGYKKLSVKIDRTAREMDRKYKSSHHVGDGAWPNGMKDYFRVEWTTPSVKMEFEGHMFNVPKNYHEYLTNFYGDYMTVPPENERVTHYLKAWCKQ